MKKRTTFKEKTISVRISEKSWETLMKEKIETRKSLTDLMDKAIAKAYA